MEFRSNLIFDSRTIIGREIKELRNTKGGIRESSGRIERGRERERDHTPSRDTRRQTGKPVSEQFVVTAINQADQADKYLRFDGYSCCAQFEDPYLPGRVGGATFSPATSSFSSLPNRFVNRMRRHFLITARVAGEPPRDK